KTLISTANFLLIFYQFQPVLEIHEGYQSTFLGSRNGRGRVFYTRNDRERIRGRGGGGASGSGKDKIDALGRLMGYSLSFHVWKEVCQPVMLNSLTKQFTQIMLFVIWHLN
ncbi:hypothetical protein KIW84_057403, partial [Lathyrus oleraceus]